MTTISFFVLVAIIIIAAVSAGDGRQLEKEVADGSCVSGSNVCDNLGENGSVAVVGENSCSGDRACYGAGYRGDITIGRNACVGLGVCNVAGYNGGTAFVGDNKCHGFYVCYRLVYSSGRATVGSSSCLGTNAWYELCNVQIGDGLCNCDDCCSCLGFLDDDNFFVVQHNSCNKLGDDECKNASKRGGMDLSGPLTPTPTASPTTSTMASPMASPTAQPKAHPPTGHYKIKVTSVRLVDGKEL
eukprot:15365394-Ditylum_brightwellii.AAC.1